jgi:small subunit ribosomal protein S8
MTDPIADLLTRIRNAVQAKHESLVVPRSKIKLAILRILKEEGFLSGYVEVDDETTGAAIKIFPRYEAGTNEGVIRGLERVSKPSRRRTCGRISFRVCETGWGSQSSRRRRA